MNKNTNSKDEFFRRSYHWSPFYSIITNIILHIVIIKVFQEISLCMHIYYTFKNLDRVKILSTSNAPARHSQKDKKLPAFPEIYRLACLSVH